VSDTYFCTELAVIYLTEQLVQTLYAFGSSTTFNFTILPYGDASIDHSQQDIITFSISNSNEYCGLLFGHSIYKSGIANNFLQLKNFDDHSEQINRKPHLTGESQNCTFF